MRIVYSYEGKESVFETAQPQVLIGRPKEGTRIDLDLSPDASISRAHARIWSEDGKEWIEDLGSRHGTQVNGEEIKGKGKRQLLGDDRIRIGDTILTVEIFDTTGRPSSQLGQLTDPNTAKRLALLYDLSLQFAAETRLDALLHRIVEQVVHAIPGAKRGALVLGDNLLLKAHFPAGSRPSTTLAEQAMKKRQAFIWPPPAPPKKEDDKTAWSPPSLLQVESAMYAPMLWKGEAVGVLCVDNSNNIHAFTEHDLRLLNAIAQQAAMAVANHQLQHTLTHTAMLLKRLLTNFSPRIRDTLLEEARLGRLRLGGKKSEVTILCSDIRGFTRISAGMEADEITDMLNEYLSVLVEILFKHDGTIDKFAGDAILVVFGSPVADAKQHEKAVLAAMEMQDAMAKLNATRKERGHVCCDIGIGVHTGEVMHGFIGSENRMEFTVIGDVVNQASRYCDGAAAGEVLISPQVYEHVWKLIDSEPKTVDTKHEGTLSAFRIKCLRS